MKDKTSRNFLRLKRKKRVLVKGTEEVPRFSVFRSSQRVYVQLIDDAEGKTLAGVLGETGKKKQELAFKAGEKLGEKAKKLGIKRAVFDRGGYKFHGQVKAIKEGAEKQGLLFTKKKD